MQVYAGAPALEEALREAGFGRDEADVFDNPIYVNPKRSSFVAVAKASKQSIFQSAASTATLSAGLVSTDLAMANLSKPLLVMLAVVRC